MHAESPSPAEADVRMLVIQTPPLKILTYVAIFVRRYWKATSGRPDGLDVLEQTDDQTGTTLHLAARGSSESVNAFVKDLRGRGYAVFTTVRTRDAVKAQAS